MQQQHRISALLGVCVGDAAGAVLEFYHKKIEKSDVEMAMNMPGGGVFRVGKGQPTDDTELTLSLLNALMKHDPSEPFPKKDIVVNYVRWMNKSRPFDYGNTTRIAFGDVIENNDIVEKVEDNARTLSMGSQANGALMRVIPISIWYHNLGYDQISEYAKQDALFSHPNIICQECNAVYARTVAFLINTPKDSHSAITIAEEYIREECGTTVQRWFYDSLKQNLLTTMDCTKNIGHVKHAFQLTFHFLFYKTSFEEALYKTLYKGGDSVTKDTPILLRDKTGNTIIKQIKDIFNETLKEDYPNFKIEDEDRREKEKSFTEYEVYTNIGFSKINKVIRHKVNKKIYRILTHCGSVDVTEDHSLFDENGNIIKPSDCTIGDKLLTSFPSFDNTLKIDIDMIINNTNLNYSIEEKRAFIYGFFYGDGSCGEYIHRNGKTKYFKWALNNQCLTNCNLLKEFCEDVYKCKFVIFDTLKSSSVYKIGKTGTQIEFIKEYLQHFYTDILKTIPSYILNAEYNIRLAFFKGYYLADGSKKEKGRIRFDNKGKIGSAQLYYLCKSLGFNVSINNCKRDIYKFNCSFKNLMFGENVIKKIIELPYTEDFVYDLETESGRFQAGIGNIIVKNTDTNAAIVCGMMGAYHGEIPNELLNPVIRFDCCTEGRNRPSDYSVKRVVEKL